MSKEHIDEIITLVEQCTELPIDDLISKEEWGTISFEQARPDLERMHGMLGPLATYPLEVLPETLRNQMKGGIEPIADTVSQIKKFKLTNGNPSQTRDGICTSLRQQLDAAHSSVGVHLPYLAYQHGDIQRNLDVLNEVIDTARSEAEKAKADQQATKAQMDTVLGAARDAAAEVGVAHFTSIFEDEADVFNGQAEGWLAFTSISAFLTVVASFLFLFWKLPDASTTAQSIGFVTSKVIFLGTLISITAWTGGQYRAAKHNQATNKHRANSLLTFQAFSQAASDMQTKEAVLLEATRTVFGATSTGYSTDSPTQGVLGTKVIEVLRTEAFEE
jgi:hypothetical protein